MFFLLKRTYRTSITKKFYLLNVLGVLVTLIFIISIFSPPISLDQTIVIDPTKDSGSYYVSGSDWFIQNYQEIQSRIQHANVYDSNIFNVNPSHIYQLIDANTLENIVFTTENLITNSQGIEWKLPYTTKTSLNEHISQMNGKP